MVSSLFVLDVRVQLSRIAAVDVPLFRPDPLCDVGRFSQRRTLDSHTGCSKNRPMSCDVPTLFAWVRLAFICANPLGNLTHWLESSHRAYFAALYYVQFVAGCAGLRLAGGA